MRLHQRRQRLKRPVKLHRIIERIGEQADPLQLRQAAQAHVNDGERVVRITAIVSTITACQKKTIARNAVVR